MSRWISCGLLAAMWAAPHALCGTDAEPIHRREDPPVEERAPGKQKPPPEPFGMPDTLARREESGPTCSIPLKNVLRVPRNRTRGVQPEPGIRIPKVPIPPRSALPMRAVRLPAPPCEE